MIGDLRVCFVGDSLVAGVGDPRGVGWPGRVVAASYADGHPVTGYNLGVRRQTSTDVLGRWQVECGHRLRDGDDLRVVFSFGANDAVVENGLPRVDTQMSELNLEVMLDQVRMRGWQALVVGPAPVADADHDGRIADLDRRFAAVAGQTDAPYVSVREGLLGDTAWMREVRAGDGAHPGASGYDELAALITPHWQAWLKR